MTIDSYIDQDYSCSWEPKEWERERARVLSRSLPGGSIIDDIKFYARKDILKLKYSLVMHALEEKTPSIYKVLTSIGLPEPY